MSTQTFNLSLPKSLVQQMDAQAKRDYASRSEFVRKAIINQLRSEQALQSVMDRANKKGKQQGYNTEQSVYDAIEQA